MTQPTGDCWNQIGVSGDRSCARLAEFIHCRNCPVFEGGAEEFFDRPAPEGYLAEWTSALAPAEVPPEADTVSVVIFRLHGEWLGLPTRVLVEVTTPRVVHRVPHRTGTVFAGLVNLRGQLQLCASLHGVLGIEPAYPPAAATGLPTVAAAGPGSRRFLVAELAGERWVFPADEVQGVQRIPSSALRKVPGTLAHASSSFSQAIFTWEGRQVGLLDEQRVFAAFRSVGQ